MATKQRRNKYNSWIGQWAMGWLMGEQSQSRAIALYFVVFFQQERHLEDLLSSAGEGREAILSRDLVHQPVKVVS